MGDVVPFVALGIGLQQAGYQVRLATHSNFQHLVNSRGLEFFPVGNDIATLLKNSPDNPFVGSKNSLTSFQKLVRLGLTQMQQLMDDLWMACQSTDVILYSTLARIAYHIAEKLGLPCFAASVHPPMSPTRVYPSYYAPKLSLGGLYNWYTHLAVEQIFWQPFRTTINRWRQKTLHLSPLPLTGPYQQQHNHRLPYLYGLSPTIFPRPTDWDDWLHMTGFWFLESPSDWFPPPELQDFLTTGSPPCCIGFGSTPINDAPALTKLLVEALGQAKQRGILVSGWGGTGDLKLPDYVLAVKSVPYDWLFPKVSAVIHQGGAGTMSLCLRSGVPSMAITFAMDQFVFGQRLSDIGAGLPPIPFYKLSVDTLTTALQVLTRDQSIRDRARALGHQVAAEDGVAKAVAAFDQHLQLVC
jgi:UDP:flavonoid glycosyltransferase YjiC (YdhE family)